MFLILKPHAQFSCFSVVTVGMQLTQFLVPPRTESHSNTTEFQSLSTSLFHILTVACKTCLMRSKWIISKRPSVDTEVSVQETAQWAPRHCFSRHVSRVSMTRFSTAWSTWTRGALHTWLTSARGFLDYMHDPSRPNCGICSRTDCNTGTGQRRSLITHVKNVRCSKKHENLNVQPEKYTQRVRETQNGEWTTQ